MISVLIVNWNTKDKLRECLLSIGLFPPEDPFEIIVVDNASNDKSAEMVRDEFPEIRLIEPGLNTGYARGNNIAFEAAKGEYLLTLNPDTVFEDNSLQRALNEFKVMKKYGAMGIRLVEPGGKRQRSVRGFPTLWNIFGEVSGLARKNLSSSLSSYSLPNFNYSVAGEAPQPMGTFLLYRKSALEEIGSSSSPFDERFPIFFNEVDLLKRLFDAGRPCWYMSDAYVVHHHGSSTKQVKKSMIWESHKSLIRYFGKHLKGPSLLLLPFAAMASYLAALIRAKGYHAGFRTQHHDM